MTNTGKPESQMDPTSRGDMEVELVRRWYEKNRESWLERRRRNPETADNFILGLIQHVDRVRALSDQELIESF